LLYGNGTNPLATTTPGTLGYVLQFNGTFPTWVAPTSLNIVAGSNTQIQFNDNGVFGASGRVGVVAAGGSAGTSTSSIGDVKFFGGNGGNGQTSDSGGGGGGAGGPLGQGVMVETGIQQMQAVAVGEQVVERQARVRREEPAEMAGTDLLVQEVVAES
jgi:hypothetical protein